MEDSDFIIMARRVLEETEQNTGLDSEELAKQVGRLQAILTMVLYDLKDAHTRLSDSVPKQES
jgi:archaellum component FlaC